MGKFTDWMKTSSRGWLNVIQTIIIVVLFVIVIISNGTRNEYDNSIREDIRSAREQLVRIEEFNNQSIELITRSIDSTNKIIEGLGDLKSENLNASNLVEKLESNNIDIERRIRELQDSTLESELVSDRIKQIQRDIEIQNGFD